MALRVLTELAEIQVLTPDWRALLERSGSNEPVLSPIWLLEWWRVYGKDRRLVVGLFYDERRLIGIAPLLRRRAWRRPGLPFRRLELLGSDVDEQDGVCSEYLNVIAEAEREGDVASAFAVALHRGEFGGWDELCLPALSGEAPMTAELAAALRNTNCVVSEEQTWSAPHIPLPSTWEEYLRLLPGRHRYKIVRSLRDFDGWAGGAAVLHCAKTPTELAEGTRILAELHTERWEAAGGSGAFAKRRFSAFHDAVMPRLLAENSLELLWLTVRDKPVAALYNLIWNNKVYFYQSGRSLEVPRHLRLGIVMLAKAIRRAICAGRLDFDFLGGDVDYKLRFALASRQLVSLRAARRTLLERTRRLAEHGIAGLRRARGAGRTALARVGLKLRTSDQDSILPTNLDSTD